MITIGALDFETDPFERGADIRPFSAGILHDEFYKEIWGDDAAEQLANYLRDIETPTILYAHNGGRFDFTFLLKWLDPECTIISNRIVSCKIGNVELRDSYAILPVALKSAGDKGEIDYTKMRRSVRNQHKVEILAYLRRDVFELLKAVTAYRARFGNKLTMAGAAIKELDKSVAAVTGRNAKYDLQRLRIDQDLQIRPFYFGGRVEAFEKGVIDMDCECIDARSMYPTAMKLFKHPTSSHWSYGADIDDCDFATVDAMARGCFPVKAEDGSNSFPHGRGTFHITGHELRMARKLGLCDVHSVVSAIIFDGRRDFADFVKTFYDLRLAAKAEKDETAVLHFKLVLNSSYGRFALNVDKLHDWMILRNGEEPHDPRVNADYDATRPWRPSSIGDDFTFWKRAVTENSKRQAIRNVATGASITGASRALLMQALHRSDRPIYCDTDSVICRSADLDYGAELGQWNIEARADQAAIAGKKLYALFHDGKEIKKASKGTRLTAEEIKLVAQGSVIKWYSETPTMGLAGQQRYMHRTVRRN